MPPTTVTHSGRRRKGPRAELTTGEHEHVWPESGRRYSHRHMLGARPHGHKGARYAGAIASKAATS